MRLIVDSGSTKTDWRGILENNEIVEFSTSGINPYHHSTEDIVEIISDSSDLINTIAEVQEIFFYGAGCSDDSTKRIVKSAIERVFNESKDIQVHHDLLGSAKALFGEKEGIVCILGTGSNCSYYNGSETQSTFRSLGYILGDEGSGTDMGKRLIRAYYYKTLPADVMTDFANQFKNDVILELYQKSYPKKYLAGFTHFLNQHNEVPAVRNIIKSSFRTFVEQHLLNTTGYNKLPIGFVGSIAFHFGNELTAVLSEYNLQPSGILQKPIDAMVEYHR